MEILNNSERKINKTVLGISAGLGILLISILLISLFPQKKQQERQSPLVVMQPVNLPKASGEEKHLVTDVLQQRFLNLRRLQKDYNSGIAAGDTKETLQKIKTAITLAEEAFRSSIDSTWLAAVSDKNTDSLQLNTIASYRKTLDSARSFNSFNTAVTDKDFVPDRESFIKLRNELMEKTNKIALLESSVEVLSKQAAARQNYAAGDVEKMTENEMAKVASLENKVTELTTGNLRLQQENDRLKKQPLETSKNSSTEQLLLSKNTALQQKVNTINAELQLVRVDCNLSRADATQIISNSKQRKQLLSEASGILMDLSASGDADIRSKVKEKIVRLNKVAANTRD